MEETTPKEPAAKTKNQSKLKKYLIWFGLGVLLCFIATTAIRCTLVKDTAVHYHAHSGLYVNGPQAQFKSFTFYV